MGIRFIRWGQFSLAEFQRATVDDVASANHKAQAIAYAASVQFSILGISDLSGMTTADVGRFYEVGLRLQAEGLISGVESVLEMTRNARAAQWVRFATSPTVDVLARLSGLDETFGGDEVAYLRKGAESWLREYLRAIGETLDSTSPVLSKGASYFQKFAATIVGGQSPWPMSNGIRTFRSDLASGVVEKCRRFASMSLPTSEYGAYISGSFSRGNFDGSSDVDIAIVGPPGAPRPSFQLNDLKLAISRDVDMLYVSLDRLSKQFTTDHALVPQMWKAVAANNIHLFGKNYLDDDRFEKSDVKKPVIL